MKQGGARCNSPIVCTALTLALLGASSTILQKKHASVLSQLQVSAKMASQAAEAKQKLAEVLLQLELHRHHGHDGGQPAVSSSNLSSSSAAPINNTDAAKDEVGSHS